MAKRRCLYTYLWTHRELLVKLDFRVGGDGSLAARFTSVPSSPLEIAFLSFCLYLLCIREVLLWCATCQSNMAFWNFGGLFSKSFRILPSMLVTQYSDPELLPVAGIENANGRASFGIPIGDRAC